MRQWFPLRLVLVACVVVGAVRIVWTYPGFNQTWDEPAHVAAGMQWLERGDYTYEPLHPRLAGIRSAGQETVWLEGNAILHARDRYDGNLGLARLGVLPFFVLGSLIDPGAGDLLRDPLHQARVAGSAGS
ncbi:MAG TPA: hypothetical protein VIQ27_03485 [Gemmatimonadales bacterium]